MATEETPLKVLEVEDEEVWPEKSTKPWEALTQSHVLKLVAGICTVLLLVAILGGTLATIAKRPIGGSGGLTQSAIKAPLTPRTAAAGAAASHSSSGSDSQGNGKGGAKGRGKIKKRGAGLLLVSGSDILLLLRAGSHNTDKWGLPGGNADEEDASLLATAQREAREEMGAAPDCKLKGEILTMRGKKDSKHFTVFICGVDAATRAAFKPALNAEHSKWQWFPLDKAVAMSEAQLHPVVLKILHQESNLAKLKKVAGIGSP